MPRNNPRGSLLNAAAGVVAPPPGDPICVAYEAALEEWCSVGPRHRNVKDGDERKGKPRSFNDMVFDRLNDSNIRDAR